MVNSNEFISKVFINFIWLPFNYNKIMIAFIIKFLLSVTLVVLAGHVTGYYTLSEFNDFEEWKSDVTDIKAVKKKFFFLCVKIMSANITFGGVVTLLILLINKNNWL